jgi:thiol-disulfide isomerase/thioredoxin
MRTLAILGLVGLMSLQQPPLPRLGQPAPAFAFSEVVLTAAALTEVSKLTPQSLNGKVVVLDFFATWCLPCIASISHTNEVVMATHDLPVVFLAVANEPRSVLAPIVEKHPMQATLVLDRNGDTYRNYWISKLPFVAIIGPDGRLAAFEHPDRLSRETILEALGRRSAASLRSW